MVCGISRHHNTFLGELTLDKKKIAELVEGFVAEVVTAHGVDAGEARTLVALTLKRNKAALLESIAIPKANIAAVVNVAA